MANKKDQTQLCFNWDITHPSLREQIKMQVASYQAQLINPAISTQTILEAYSYFVHLLTMAKEEYDALELVYSVHMQIINCLTKVLVLLSYIDQEKFYFLAELFFEHCEELFSYFSGKEYDELNQGTIGLIRSLYLNIMHKKNAQALKKNKTV